MNSPVAESTLGERAVIVTVMLDGGLESGTNIGSGVPLSVNQVHGALARVLGVTARPRHVPAMEGELRYSIADITKARELLSYDPTTPLTAGLPKAIAWQREAGFLDA